MNSVALHGLVLYFDEREAAAAQLVRQGCDAAVPILTADWGLPTPPDCRVYVMTSWVRFVFHSAPWPRRLAYAVCFPVVWLQAVRVWPYAGGWNLPQGRRMAVGIKPPRLIDSAERGLGRRIFTSTSPAESVRRITCHELTHAFSAHLHLPAWLHEGLAMVTVDRALGQPTVLAETLEWLRAPRPPVAQPRVRDPQAMLEVYARGYWLTRYLAEARPGLLPRLLERPRPPNWVEDRVASELGTTRAGMWAAVGPLVSACFGTSTCPARASP
jgi:hypothetical protein